MAMEFIGQKNGLPFFHPMTFDYFGYERPDIFIEQGRVRGIFIEADRFSLIQILSFMGMSKGNP
jgi:hypothetical protein